MLSYKGSSAAQKFTLRMGFALALGATLTGCAVGPKYHRPTVNLQPFHNAPSIETRTSSLSAPPLDQWWTGFRDPELTRIVKRALDQNLDLAAAMTRVQQARAAAQGAGARRMPSGNLYASTTTLYQSTESMTGRLASHLPGYSRTQNYYDLGFIASWETDLFGGLKKGAQAATAEAQAAEASQTGTRITVAAEAADAYMQIRGAQARLIFAKDQIATDEHLVELVQQRKDAGVASDRELAQAQALLSQAKATIPLLTVSLEAQLNRLDVLMGAQPGTYAAELSSVADIPDVPEISGYGTPTDLLRRRPDIIAAERMVAASNARIGQALVRILSKALSFRDRRVSSARARPSIRAARISTYQCSRSALETLRFRRCRRGSEASARRQCRSLAPVSKLSPSRGRRCRGRLQFTGPVGEPPK